jgi:hypothetical protein
MAAGAAVVHVHLRVLAHVTAGGFPRGASWVGDQLEILAARIESDWRRQQNQRRGGQQDTPEVIPTHHQIPSK